MSTTGQRMRLRRIIPFAVIWLIGGIIYSVIVKGILADSTSYPATGVPYDFRSSFIITSIACVLMGAIMGGLEAGPLNRLFRNRTFAVRIIFKALLYTGAIVIFLQSVNTIYLSRMFQAPWHSAEVLGYIARSFTYVWFWSIILYVGAVATVTLLLTEFQQHVTHNVIGNFFTGRYDKPRQEERIFMFLDMRSSTTLAERMGHERFFALLNRYYADLTRCISDTAGEVWQYVGDEVVITWTIEKGLREADCVRCFFLMRDALRARAAVYERDFGYSPGFKAGLHCGTVTTGEIGTVRKDIVFTGDVMNTTARIQSLCNAEGVDLLISDALLKRLELPAGHVSRIIGERELKGKDERVLLHTIERSVQLPVASDEQEAEVNRR